MSIKVKKGAKYSVTNITSRGKMESKKDGEGIESMSAYASTPMAVDSGAAGVAAEMTLAKLMGARGAAEAA